MDSIWQKTSVVQTFAPLSGDLHTEVLVIGGGLAGLLCVYELSRRGVDCVLVEAGSICGGVTGKTTAKITAQHGLIYDKLLHRYGLQTAKSYLCANLDALEQYRQMCRDIDCDFQQQDSYVYARRELQPLLQEMAALEKLGAPAEFLKTATLPFPVAGSIRFSAQAQFHPLKFAAAIAKGLPIYSHTRVLELKPGQAVTPYGTIFAKNTVIATHFPFLNKHGGYFLKLYQQRSYVLALENAPLPDGMYYSPEPDGLSFRSHNGLLLLGGGGHRTGKQGGNWQVLREFAAKTYPQAREVAHWATQDCMSLDSMPFIGQYGKRTNSLYVAAGFNKWGMTSSMVAARLLADLLCGKKNPYAEVFSPQRTVWHPQLAANGYHSVLGLLTPTVPRCPHMGCALKYNRQEHSWDCSCHGSRFSVEGKLLDNPANGDKHLS